MIKCTEAQLKVLRAVEFFQRNNTATCAIVGREVWGDRSQHGAAQARSAGAILKRLKDKGLVWDHERHGPGWMTRTWRLTPAGRREIGGT